MLGRKKYIRVMMSLVIIDIHFAMFEYFLFFLLNTFLYGSCASYSSRNSTTAQSLASGLMLDLVSVGKCRGAWAVAELAEAVGGSTPSTS